MAHDAAKPTMKIVTLVPFFREDHVLTRECFDNVASYADAAVVCVNDRYDRETEDFLRSFPIVQRVAFVNKDSFSDAIFNSSLLTMAQELHPDWIVKQDIDEELEPRFANIRELLSQTHLEWITLLWPSFVQDRDHLCYYHHEYATGVHKAALCKFDLEKLYIPAGSLSNLSMADARSGITNIRLFHKNQLKSDQEYYTKLILSGRELAQDGVVDRLRKTQPDTLIAGEKREQASYANRAAVAERLLPYTFRVDPPAAQEIAAVESLTREMFGDWLSVFHPSEDIHKRLTAQFPVAHKRNPVLSLAIKAARKSGLTRHMRRALQTLRSNMS